MSDDLFREPNAVVFVPAATPIPEVMEILDISIATAKAAEERAAEEFDPNYGLGPEPTEPEMTERQLLEKLALRIETSEDQLAKLTDAVNTFGQMLDFIVKSVEGMSNMVQEKGLMGIMQMAMGGNKNG